MVRTFRNRPVARAVVALAGASLLLAACGGGDDGGDTAGGGGSKSEGVSTGVTDTTIKIGTHMPLTGVAAPGYSEIPTGAKAYFDYVNAAGRHQRPQDRVLRQGRRLQPGRHQQVTNQLVLQEQVFGLLGGLGTPTHSAVLDFLNEEEVPDLFVSSGACSGTTPRSTRGPSAGSRTTRSRARSSASTSPRTSPTPRSACSCRATTSVVTAPRARSSSCRSRSSPR